MELVIDTPAWAEPLLAPARYKGAHGGRGCCHPDTLIDTPIGQVKISEFKGGDIYALHEGRVVVATATASVPYTEEQLYLVRLRDGREISVTDQHRFLTQRGWVECRDLSMSDAVVVSQRQDAYDHLPTSQGIAPLAFREDDLHCSGIRADYPDGYSSYSRRYDQQPLSAKDTGQSFPKRQDDERPHNSRALTRRGAPEFWSKDNPSLPLRRLSIRAFPPAKAGKDCGAMGIHNAGKTFARLLGSCQSLPQSLMSTGQTLQDAIFFQPRLYLCNWKNQAGNQQKQQHMPPCVVRDGSFFSPSCNHSTPILVEIESICKHDRLIYWDLHVPILENYLSNGIVNHNSGKSHFFAELMIEEHVANPNRRSVCIREIQKSLQFSARELLKQKITALGVGHLFDITLTEIRSKLGNGIIIFQGMQDHTADSIKSLEGFDCAWVEEAQNLSARSLELLRPTIRNENSEIWFSWNPDQPDDPVDALLRPKDGNPPNCIVVEVNYCDNPFLPSTLREEMEFDRKYNPDSFGHVWLGEYNTKTESQIFKGKWSVDEFEPGEDWQGPYHGLDFGFANDPTAAVKCWTYDQCLWVEYEAGRVGLELDDTADYLDRNIPGICSHVVRADSARPESISYLKRPDPEKKRKHIPRIEPVKKWTGSVEDGIEFIKSFKRIIIHVRCTETQKEARLYSFKTDKRTGDILPEIEDKHNHYWDAIRYAVGGLIKGKYTIKISDELLRQA